jgi:hypothetical protein
MKKLILVVALTLIASVAFADTKTIQDAKGDNNSDQGGQGDIRSVTATHTKSGKLKFKIVQWNTIEGRGRPRNAPMVVITTNTPDATCANEKGELYSFGGEDDNDQVYAPCADPSDEGFYATKNPNPYTRVFIVHPKWLGSPDKIFWGVRTNGDEAPDEAHATRWFFTSWQQYAQRHRL